MTTFHPTVERWRHTLAILAPELPVDFLLAWIQRESDGMSSSRTKLDERGLFQIHPDELKMLDAQHAAGSPPTAIQPIQFDRLLGGSPGTPDGDYQCVCGLRLVRYYLGVARRDLEAVGATWAPSEGLYKLVKLCHCLPLDARSFPIIFRFDVGRPPSSWDELVAHIRLLAVRGDKRLVVQASYGIERCIKNAEAVGGCYWPTQSPPQAEYATTLARFQAFLARLLSW